MKTIVHVRNGIKDVIELDEGGHPRTKSPLGLFNKTPIFVSSPGHMMIDIETLSKKDNAIILSIGAAMFDPKSGNIGSTFYVRSDFMKTERKFPGKYHMDAETISWWMMQSKEAREEVFGGFVKKFGKDQETMVNQFFLFCSMENNEQLFNNGGKNPIRYWAKGPDFDMRILGKSLEIINQPLPWYYNSKRDVRTFTEHDPGVYDRIKNKDQHNALGDALYQIKVVKECYGIINKKRG